MIFRIFFGDNASVTEFVDYFIYRSFLLCSAYWWFALYNSSLVYRSSPYFIVRSLLEIQSTVCLVSIHHVKQILLIISFLFPWVNDSNNRHRQRFILRCCPGTLIRRWIKLLLFLNNPKYPCEASLFRHPPIIRYSAHFLFLLNMSDSLHSNITIDVSLSLLVSALLHIYHSLVIFQYYLFVCYKRTLWILLLIFFLLWFLWREIDLVHVLSTAFS